MAESQDVGAIGWIDLTVENASEIRVFYSQVIGWKSEAVSMGDYDDFNMTAPESGEARAGICHARGGNAGLPSQWLLYITVRDLDASTARCVDLGGKIVAGPKGSPEQGRYCVIEDPAGAVAALYEMPPG